ncbi:dihydrofolate reductase [Ornithinimicrobium sp. Arc0846-15]|nr:dihydrofolate reductase [Ornithinimicrobium laminariae]
MSDATSAVSDAAQSLTFVVAMGRNRVIGDGVGMPWHLPEDLAHFKRTTLGGTMLMGRRTFDSIGRALPGRRSVVITRDTSWSAPGVEVAHSIAEALDLAGAVEVFVIGGGNIYEQTLPQADRIVLTEIDQEPPGSVFFPDLDSDEWSEASRDQRDGFAFVELQRKTTS